jgi:hypothetical protein
VHESPGGLDHRDDILSAVAPMSSELDQFSYSFDHRTLVRRSRHRDSSPPRELQQTLVPENVHGTKHGVLVHAEYGGNIFDHWETLAWSGFTFGNRSTDLGGDLIVEWDRLCAVDVDFQHGPSHSSSVHALWEEEK